MGARVNGRGCPCYRAGLASKRRQDAEAQLAWSERRQDAVATVRRDGTGNPDPLDVTRENPPLPPAPVVSTGREGEPQPVEDLNEPLGGAGGVQADEARKPELPAV